MLNLGVSEVNSNTEQSTLSDGLDSAIIKEPHYMDMIRLAPSFISLDISVKSTGWAKWLNGVLTYGTYTLKTPKDNPLQRRNEFKDFLQWLYGDDYFEYTFVEDVIGGVNFETNNALYQLNPIVDDMLYDGKIKGNIENIHREDNMKWKRNIAEFGKYESQVRGRRKDKAYVEDCMENIGFFPEAGTIQDVYDAVGLAVGVLYRLKAKAPQKRGKLRKDINKGFEVKQFATLKEVEKSIARRKKIKDYVVLDWSTNLKRNLEFAFKDYVETEDTDSNVLVIILPTSKIGKLALDNNFDLHLAVSYLLVVPKR